MSFTANLENNKIKHMKFLLCLVCCLFISGKLWAVDYVVVFKSKNIDTDRWAHAVLCSKIKRMNAMTWAWTKEGGRKLELSMHTFHTWVEIPDLDNLHLVDDQSTQRFKDKHKELTDFYNRYPKTRPLMLQTLETMTAMVDRLDNGDVCDNGHWVKKGDYLEKKAADRKKAEAKKAADRKEAEAKKAADRKKAEDLAKKQAKAKAEAEMEAIKLEEERRRNRIEQLNKDIEKLKNEILAVQKNCESKLKLLGNIASSP